MGYELKISANTEHQIAACIDYIIETLKNPSAAGSVLEDISSAYDELENSAGSFALCDDPYLASKGYRKLALAKHDYVFVYRVVENTVYLQGFFHMRENYRTRL